MHCRKILYVPGGIVLPLLVPLNTVAICPEAAVVPAVIIVPSEMLATNPAADFPNKFVFAAGTVELPAGATE